MINLDDQNLDTRINHKITFNQIVSFTPKTESSHELRRDMEI